MIPCTTGRNNFSNGSQSIPQTGLWTSFFMIVAAIRKTASKSWCSLGLPTVDALSPITPGTTSHSKPAEYFLAITAASRPMGDAYTVSGRKSQRLHLHRLLSRKPRPKKGQRKEQRD